MNKTIAKCCYNCKYKNIYNYSLIIMFKAVIILGAILTSYISTFYDVNAHKNVLYFHHEVQ